MAKSVITKIRKVLLCAAHFDLERGCEFDQPLTEEEWRRIRTWQALEASVEAVPHEIIEQTVQLRARNPEAFENSTLALCNAIGDDFSPAAAEFVERINNDMRSEIDLGPKQGPRLRPRGASGCIATRQRGCIEVSAAGWLPAST
jgi:hypothetical protein